MKDIESLFLTAKSGGRASDITAYTEAVQELLESDPNGYMSNLEYIISSSIGINTWNPFIEKYGLPIACYDYVVDIVESCIEKAEAAKQDTSVYEEVLEDLEEFKENYSSCFMMYESMVDHIIDNYEYYEEKAINMDENIAKFKSKFKFEPIDMNSFSKDEKDHLKQLASGVGNVKIHGTITVNNTKYWISFSNYTWSSKRKYRKGISSPMTLNGLIGLTNDIICMPKYIFSLFKMKEIEFILYHEVGHNEVQGVDSVNRAFELMKNVFDHIDMDSLSDKEREEYFEELNKIADKHSEYVKTHSKSEAYNKVREEFRKAITKKYGDKGHINPDEREADFYGAEMTSDKVAKKALKKIDAKMTPANKTIRNMQLRAGFEINKNNLNKLSEKKLKKLMKDSLGITGKEFDKLSKKEIKKLKDDLLIKATKDAKKSVKKEVKSKDYNPNGKETKVRLKALKDEDARTTFRDMINMEYADIYYGYTDGVQNKNILSGMMEEFHELAIPDLLISADVIGENAVCQVLECVMHNDISNPLFNQYMMEAVCDMSSVGESITDFICEYVDSEEELTIFEEKSHGKLKFDFRAAINVKDGHPIKIVYSLDNMKFSTKKKKGWGKESYKDLIKQYDKDKDRENRVKQKGNTDHRSKGQEVVAIVDLITGEKLKEADYIGIFNAEAIKHIDGKDFNEEKARKYAKKKGLHIYHVKVGDIEDKYTFKSTYWNSKFDNIGKVSTINGLITGIGMDVSPRESRIHTRGVENLTKDKDIEGDQHFLNNVMDVYRKSGFTDREITTLLSSETSEEMFTKACTGLRSMKSESDYKSFIKELEKWIDNGGSKKDTYDLYFKKPDKEFLERLKKLNYQEAKIQISGLSKEQRKENKRLRKIKESVIIQDFFEYAYTGSYQAIVDDMIRRNTSIIQESAIMGMTENAFTYYTEEEIDALTEYITFKEYQLTYTDPNNAMDIFNEICSLYEQLDGIITESGDLMEEDVADNILPQLPNTQGLTEAPWLTNTMNKKTGNIPTYLGRNHNLGYGEDDKPSSGDEDPEDFKRPSAGGTADDKADVISKEDDGDIEVDKDERHEQNPVNNYYYYTYNNSLNKNSHSFNKDSENTTSTDRHDRHDSHDRYDKHDDHSVHNTTRRVVNDSSTKDNHSSTIRTVDDHSTGKRINSNDYERKTESRMPWELDILPANSLYTEDVGDADDMKPESDHPIKDTLTDIDRELVKTQQKAKKKVQEIQNVGRAVVKPVKRTNNWIMKMVSDWKDKDETRIKEKMSDPHARKNLYSAIKKAIAIGAFAKAGLLLNPIFLVLGATRAIGKNKREYRIRNEMIGELKAEIEIINKKIEDAERNGDDNAKYKLMRLRNEINKKLLRVGGSKGWKKII